MPKSAVEILRADLSNEVETIRSSRERVTQCEALFDFAVAEEIREILRQDQEHAIDLATAPDIERQPRLPWARWAIAVSPSVDLYPDAVPYRRRERSRLRAERPKPPQSPGLGLAVVMLQGPP